MNTENDHVSRNGQRIKTTQPTSMILVSFFSVENILSDEAKTYNIGLIFEWQSSENLPFRFLWDTGILE